MAVELASRKFRSIEYFRISRGFVLTNIYSVVKSLSPKLQYFQHHHQHHPFQLRQQVTFGSVRPQQDIFMSRTAQAFCHANNVSEYEESLYKLSEDCCAHREALLVDECAARIDIGQVLEMKE